MSYWSCPNFSGVVSYRPYPIFDGTCVVYQPYPDVVFATGNQRLEGMEDGYIVRASCLALSSCTCTQKEGDVGLSAYQF